MMMFINMGRDHQHHELVLTIRTQFMNTIQHHDNQHNFHSKCLKVYPVLASNCLANRITGKCMVFSSTVVLQLLLVGQSPISTFYGLWFGQTCKCSPLLWILFVAMTLGILLDETFCPHLFFRNNAPPKRGPIICSIYHWTIHSTFHPHVIRESPCCWRRHTAGSSRPVRFCFRPSMSSPARLFHLACARRSKQRYARPGRRAIAELLPGTEDFGRTMGCIHKCW